MGSSRTGIGLFQVEREQFSIRQGLLGIVAILGAVVRPTA
jgi:hypothetical protein